MSFNKSALEINATLRRDVTFRMALGIPRNYANEIVSAK
jgi:hypothetical protein